MARRSQEMRDRRRRRGTPPGFKYVGNRLVPLEGTIFNEETQEWDVGVKKKQSGDDWGMEDPLEGSGSDIMDMDPSSPEFAAAMAAEMEAGPTEIPGEPDSSGFSSDFTDSGFQTSYDPEDTIEEETEEAGYIPVKEGPHQGGGGIGSEGGADWHEATPEDKDEYGGKGYAQRTKGYNPFLKIKKESKGKKGKFTRGSLRVRKPRRMAV